MSFLNCEQLTIRLAIWHARDRAGDRWRDAAGPTIRATFHNVDSYQGRNGAHSITF